MQYQYKNIEQHRNRKSQAIKLHKTKAHCIAANWDVVAINLTKKQNVSGEPLRKIQVKRHELTE